MRIRHASSLSSIRFQRSASDPHWANVVLLLGYSGVAGNTVFVDESPIGHTITTVGSFVTTLDPAKAGFGGAGSPAGDYLIVEFKAGDPFNAGTGDYTFETFVRATGDITNISIFGSGGLSGSGYHWGLRFNSGGVPVFTAGTTPFALSFVDTLSVDTWYHLAASRVSGVTYAFIDGVLKGSSSTAHTIAGTTTDATIGRLTGIPDLTGALEETRITVGVGRYTATFTPPALPFARG